MKTVAGRSSRLRYVNGRARTIAIVACGEVFWLMLIGVVHLHRATDRAGLTLAALLVLVLAIRSGVSHVVILEPHRLWAKTLLRTRCWTYSELRSAATRTDGEGCGGCVVIVTPKVGKPFSFAVLPEPPEQPSFIDPFVDEINARIAYAEFVAAMAG